MSMDQDRLVLVENTGQGTGYVVGPRLVLTAGHAVELTGTPVIKLTRSKVGFAASVIWHRHDDSVDAALLRITDPDWPDDIPQNPVRWGRLVTLRAGATWEALAFPRGYRDELNQLDVAHLSGRLNPGDMMLSKRYSLRLEGGSPAVAGPSPWAGASGAALFIDDLLCGVVTVDPTQWGNSRLEAVPVGALFADSRFQDALGVKPIVEPVEFQPIAVPQRPRPLRSLVDILHPDSALVPFHGPAKEETLPIFLQWCNEDHPSSVGLLYGAGGRGKTRLAAELASALNLTGWIVVNLLRPELISSPERYNVVGAATSPVMLIVDYAETRIEQIKILIQSVAERQRLRVLLLARSAGEWWEDLRDQMPGRSIAQALPPIALNPDEWRIEYRTALSCLVDGLTHVPRYANTDWKELSRFVGEPSRVLSDGTALTIHMAALASLLNSTIPISDAEDRPLEEQVIAHERRYWEESAKATGLLAGQGAFGPLPPVVLKLLVATTVLVRPNLKSHARQLLASVPGLTGEHQESVRISAADWLRVLYPARDDSYWGTLQPDRLGEYHLGLCIRDEPEFVQRLVQKLDDQGVAYALAVLARVAVHGAHRDSILKTLEMVFTQDPTRIATAAVAVATQTEHPDYLIEPLDKFTHSSDAPDVIEAISAAVPQHTHVLGEFAATVSRHYVDVLKKQLDWDQRKDIDISRRRVRANASNYLKLVQALNNHSVRIANLGFETEALEYIDLAAKIGRHLPAGSAALLSLGRVHNNRANRLENLGRLETAIKVGKEAVATYRRLLSHDPVEVLPGLAGALTNQASRLDRAGKPKRAFVAIAEATQIYRQLSNIAPTFKSGFTGTLLNLSTHLSRNKNYDAALAAILEAETNARDLTEEQPDSSLATLADVLHNKSIILENLERYDDALSSIDESLSIHAALLESIPNYYGAARARSLAQRANVLHATGRRDETISALQAGVEAYQDLIEGYPEETVHDFMSVLTNAGYILKELELYEDSRWCVEEALAAYIAIARDNSVAARMILRMEDLLVFHQERDPSGGRVRVEKARNGSVSFHMDIEKSTLSPP